MEKNSLTVLTPEDLRVFNEENTVSFRLQEIWGLTYDELKQIISNGNYTVVGNNSDSP